MLGKSRVIYLICILFFVLLSGFLIWNFSSPVKSIFGKILSETNQLDSKLFTASVNTGYQIAATSPDASSDDSQTSSDTAVMTQQPIVIASESVQDRLDDLQEQLDVAEQKLADITNAENIRSSSDVSVKEELADERISDKQTDIEQPAKSQNNASQAFYPKILISEVVISPISERFVELYNPGSTDVNLTGWYMQRKTQGDDSWNSFVSSTGFQNKIIPSGNYFLISRELSNSDIFSDITLSQDNSLALKNPNGDISDKLGFGQATDFEMAPAQNPGDGQGIGRQNREQDTGNNSADFELTAPTPRSENMMYAPVPDNGGGGGGEGGVGGSSDQITYSKILISEVQISPINSRFIELYNPNNTAVNLTGWYLQRKDANDSSWNSFVPSSDFNNEIISSNDYFVISNQLPGSQITSDITLSDDNALALKNPNGDIADKLGLGQATDFETAPAQNPGDGQTVGRKTSAGVEQDTGDNASDFELQSATPGEQNVTYSGPIISPPPGGESPPATYPNILISEIKIAEKTGDNNVFIELYNPGNADADLTGWYIFRNDASCITKTVFSGKKIPAGGYFLITKQGSIWDGQADVSFSSTLNGNDNISLKNPNGDVSDQVSWTQINPGLSLGRKWDLGNNTEQDTGDNSADFELDTMTPKLQNVAYVAPPAPSLVSIAISKPASKLVYAVGDALDITGLAVSGTYSDNSVQIENITNANITGFDSTVANPSEVLTITVNGISTSYAISVIEASPAPSGAIQLKIISTPQTILAGSPSSVFTVESQNSQGVKTAVASSTIVRLSSSSATGMFSSKSSSDCGTDWTKTSITISKGDEHKSFCYEDKTPGIFTITISSGGLSSDSQNITVNQSD